MNIEAEKINAVFDPDYIRDNTTMPDPRDASGPTTH